MTRTFHRRHKLTLELEGDNWQAIVNQLRYIEYRICEAMEYGEETINIRSGVSDANFVLHVTTDPEMDHDKYFELVNQYLEDKKEKLFPITQDEILTNE